MMRWLICRALLQGRTVLNNLFIAAHAVPAHAVTVSYQPLLVGVSFLTVAAAAYIAILLLRNIAHGLLPRHYGCALAAGILGAGVWSMHVTGMLAMNLSMLHHYHVGILMLALLVATGTAWWFLQRLTSGTIAAPHATGSALVFGAGIVLTHYLSMGAMQMDATLRFLPLHVATSVAVAMLFSAAGLLVLRRVCSDRAPHPARHIMAALLLACAIGGMHFLGMASAIFIPAADCRFDANQAHIGPTLGVACATALIFLAGLFIAMVQNKRLSRSSVQASCRGFMAASVLFVATLGAGYLVYVNAERALLQDVQRHLTGVAHIAASLTDGDTHKKITLPEHRGNPDYLRVQKPYYKILRANPDLAYVYTAVLRGGKVYLVIDTEILPTGSPPTTSGAMEEYSERTLNMLRALKLREARVESRPYSDKWGTFLSAYAPFYDSKGNFVGVAGADMRLDIYNAKLMRVKETLYAVIIAGFVAAGLVGIGVWFLIYRHAMLEEKYGSLITRIPAIFFNCDNDTDWTMNFLNDQCETVTGYPASDFIRNAVRSFNSLIHPEDREMVARIIAERFTKNQKYDIEYRICCADGTVKWVSEQGIGIADDAGRITQIEGFIVDNSARKKIEIALYERQRMLEMAEEMAGLGHWKIDVTSGSLHWSHQTFLIHGIRPDAPQPSLLDAITFFHPEDQTEIQRIAKSALDAKESFRFIRRLQRADGEERIVELFGEPEMDLTGKLVAVVGTLQDITERQQSSEKLMRSNMMLERFFSISLDLLGVANINGNFVRLNKAWQETLGYDISSLEGKPFLPLVHPDDQPATIEALAQLSKGQLVLNFSNRYRCSDGSYKIIEWRCNPSSDGFIYFAARDITKRRQTEEELEQLRNPKEQSKSA